MDGSCAGWSESHDGLLIAVPVMAVAIVAGLALFAAWTAFRIGKALPPQGQFIEIEGTRIYSVDRGQGPAIVMIPGLGGQLRNFTNSLLDRLTDELRGTVNLTLLLARSGVSVRSGPCIFNRLDPSRNS
jgi:hypothetical protein